MKKTLGLTPEKSGDIPRRSDTSQGRLKAYPIDEDNLQNTKWIKLFTIISVATWLLVTIILFVFVLKIQETYQSYSPFQWIGLLGVLLAPIFLIIVTIYALKQLVQFSRRSNRLLVAAMIRMSKGISC